MTTTNTTCMFCATARPTTFANATIDGLNPVYAGAGSIGLAVLLIVSIVAVKMRGQTRLLRAEQQALIKARAATRAVQKMG